MCNTDLLAQRRRAVSGSCLSALILTIVVSGCSEVQTPAGADSVSSNSHSEHGTTEHGTTEHGTTEQGTTEQGTTEQDDETDKEKLRILFLGNSHTSYNNVPGSVKKLIESGGEVSVIAKTIGGTFLETIASRADVKESIKTGDWDVVVMQGQKISMSGRYNYSTKEAEELSTLANASGAKVVWFSEWGRRGVEGESDRTQKIYQQISDVNDDTLAPVGEAWEAVFLERPKHVLHGGDGNHANVHGSFLAALTLYVAITGEDCKVLSRIEANGINADTQSFFKTIVSEVTEDLVTDDEQPKSNTAAKLKSD